jgi:phytoene dehydrogenase-like protein
MSQQIIVEDGRAVGIQLRKGGKRVRARRAVVSNASIWDVRAACCRGL